jgi:hypothetical protein
MRLCCYWVFSFPVVNLIFAYQCFYYSGWHQCWSHMCKIGVGAHSTPSWVFTVTSLGAVSVMHCPHRLCHLWVFAFFSVKIWTHHFFLLSQISCVGNYTKISLASPLQTRSTNIVSYKSICFEVQILLLVFVNPCRLQYLHIMYKQVLTVITNKTIAFWQVWATLPDDYLWEGTS